MDQWIRTEHPEINPYTDGQLIFDKGGKDDNNGQKTVSSASGVGKAGQPHVYINDAGTFSHYTQK